LVLKQLEVTAMARFLITHHGGDEIPREADGRPDPEFVPGGSVARNNAVVSAWLSETASSVVDWGGSVRPAATVSGEGTNAGLAAGPLHGWTVIEAPDADVAARLLQNHPFVILSGGILQIWEPDNF
jgi:hypothetical protein